MRWLDPEGEKVAPARMRMIVSALIVILIVAALWKFIDYRMQPPPPPHPIGQRVEVK